MSLRARILIFLAVCVLCGLLVPNPWTILPPAVTYLVVVFPAIPKGPHRE